MHGRRPLTWLRAGRGHSSRKPCEPGPAAPSLPCFVSKPEGAGSGFPAPGKLAGHLAPFGTAARIPGHRTTGHLICQTLPAGHPAWDRKPAVGTEPEEKQLRKLPAFPLLSPPLPSRALSLSFLQLHYLTSFSSFLFPPFSSSLYQKYFQFGNGNFYQYAYPQTQSPHVICRDLFQNCRQNISV